MKKRNKGWRIASKINELRRTRVPDGAQSVPETQASAASPGLAAKFTFVGADGVEQTFVPAGSSGRIRAVAERLRALVPPGSSVGLLYRSEPDLLVVWFASLLAGLSPLIMQYPTRKQAMNYWIDSISNTVATVRLGAVIADVNCSNILSNNGRVNVLSNVLFDGLADEADGRILPDEFGIIQLSSGTTGHRKAITFSSSQLHRHVHDYNVLLGLSADDTIVSWLPLYHDMGYIACFVMPLLLGVDVVMLDPMTWVQEPVLLFEAIGRHSGTICYMPNFGFEVMSRVKPQELPTIRKWISCSEPVSETTTRKFLSRMNSDPATFAACYAMAENVFAVTIKQGCSTRSLNGNEVVSCGSTIPGVEVRLVDDEIWVRSPTSIVNYLDTNDVRDSEGYYATGDLGEIIDGELFILGRKQDLLVQAGRKFMLSDIDIILNNMSADIRGRAATVGIRDERLGTEKPLVLIEAANFFSRSDGHLISRGLADATGIDQVEVAFVPPHFITKTSSGKINRRKVREDWIALNKSDGSDRHKLEPFDELRLSFVNYDWNKPVGDILDSLSRTILRIVLENAEIDFDARLSLAEFGALLKGARSEFEESTSSEARTGFRIISFADRNTLKNITAEHLTKLSEQLGCEVTLEHVCLPPSPVFFSDLIFHDYFEPRMDRRDFIAIDDIMEKVKGASILITDDVAELVYLYESTYPVLSHKMVRHAEADLISYRWQHYTQFHDRLPLSIVGGLDIPLSASNSSVSQLEAYLNIPTFRMASVKEFAPFTSGWEQFVSEDHAKGLDGTEVIERLLNWASVRRAEIKQRPLRKGPSLLASDLAHFCSHAVKKEAVDMVLGHFESFCISGQAASLPYVERELKRLGKAYVRVPSHSSQVMKDLPDPFDVLLICGSVGAPPNNIPSIALQHADQSTRTRNLGEFGDTLPTLNHIPSSDVDWFYQFEFAGGKDYRCWSKARTNLFSPSTRSDAPRPDGARDFIIALYRLLLKRQPNKAELELWTEVAASGRKPAEILTLFRRSPEYLALNAEKSSSAS